MARIPMPPGYEEKSEEIPTIKKESSPMLVTQKELHPVDAAIQSKKIGRDETTFILRRNLSRNHYNDPNVMKYIAEYLICRDNKQAARAAGLTTRDGSLLRKKPDIAEALRQITEQACFKNDFDAADLIAKTKEVLETNLAELQREDGSFIENLNEVSPEMQRAIKSFVVKNTYALDGNGIPTFVESKIIKVELWDKMKAIELLGREKDTFKESKKVVHEMAKNMASTLLESRRLALETAEAMRDVGIESSGRDVGQSSGETSGDPNGC